MSDCAHEGFHSGSARYDAAARTMHFVVVCDDCGQVIRDLSTERYEPRPRLEAHDDGGALAVSS